MIVTVTLNPCVDRTIYVDELRLGRVIRAGQADTIAGGKGNNVARVAKALGEDVRPVILAGGETGQLIDRLLKERDGLEPLVCPIGQSSREVVTVLEERTGVQTAYVEPGPRVTADETQACMEAVSAAFVGADLVVFSGSVPCPEMADVYARLIPLAHEARTPVILDTRGEALRLGLEASPDVLNCNRDEAQQLLKRRLLDVNGAAQAARDLRQRGPHWVTLTLGSEGFVACGGDATWHVSPPRVEVVNAVGAGDALVAALAVGLLRKLPPEGLLRFAQAVAAACLRHWHAGAVNPADIPNLLARTGLRKLLE